MRTTLNINEKLLKEVVALTKEKDKGKAVNKALEEYVRQMRIKELLALRGKLDLDLDDWYEFRHMER
ncbi:MAG: type II toxin-antitoxin system VapB family antitoxin [Chloroflexi bacterium]|nr:type II toxin-antitoxin system VapB family antitoxin [Chloroflexota bacterium]